MTTVIFIYFSNEKNLSQQIGLEEIFSQKKCKRNAKEKLDNSCQVYKRYNRSFMIIFSSEILC